MDAKITVGAVIEKDGKILLVQEAKKIVYGLWNLPAGKLQPPENVLDAAVREAKEETGFDVKIDGVIRVYQSISKEDGNFYVGFRFKASIISGMLNVPKNEILDAKWFSPGEILAMDDSKLRGRTVKAVLRDYLAGKLYPVDAIKYLK